MADFSSVFFSTITEINAKLLAKEFSCVELTRAFCERLEKIAPRYNALALSLQKEAIKQAHEVDDDLHHGRTRGPLQGIPYGAKDLLAVAGKPTAWGAKPLASQVFQDDAYVIQKLHKVGAILTGKLAMVELAGGGDYRLASASISGPGLNPWDPSKWSGGSSSGSAAAVAAGLVTFALGSETSGSIITPASYCGVTGLRPTYGLVSRSGAMALSWTLDKIGPLCRSAEDCALVLHVIAGGDDADPGSAGRSFSYNPQFVRKPAEITIGYAPVDFDEWADPGMRAGLNEALGVVKGLGYKTTEVELPDFPYGALVGTVIAGEAGSIFEDFIRSGQVDQLADPSQIAGLKTMLETPAIDYLRAMRARRLVQQGFHDVFLNCDVLLTPARFDTAPSASEPLDSPVSGPRPSRRGLSGIIPGGNLAGLPALSLPCGFAEGLPIGISLVGRPFYENWILTIGAAFQSQTDWHRRKPPVQA